ncbi:thioredoxin family protein [Clostridium sp. WILCCON 0269]|uniref:Thioredoxin n=1 Tax=Candidatus Clostridium eludens TaxID=3381663 RepID=A0ABW8SQ36_9CLOT
MDREFILSIKEDNFDNLTFENNTPAVVFFNAERCKVCNIMHPIIEEIAKNYYNKLNVYSVDVDKHGELAQRFRLNGIPTLLIFKEGEIIEKITGFHNKDALDKIIKTAIDNIESKFTI